VPNFGNVYPYSSIYPGKFNIAPTPEPTVIVDEPSWADAASDGSARAFRVVIPASAISESASTVQVQFVTGTGAEVVGAYIGHQAGSGDAYDFDGTQVELLFGGTSGVTIASGNDAYSDTTTYSVDSSKNLVISWGFDATDRNYQRVTGDPSSTYVGGTNADIGTTDVSSYTIQGGGGYVYFVGEILKIS